MQLATSNHHPTGNHVFTTKHPTLWPTNRKPCFQKGNRFSYRQPSLQLAIIVQQATIHLTGNHISNRQPSIPPRGQDLSNRQPFFQRQPSKSRQPCFHNQLSNPLVTILPTGNHPLNRKPSKQKASILPTGYHLSSRQPSFQTGNRFSFRQASFHLATIWHHATI
jgi:hypothetical protein